MEWVLLNASPDLSAQFVRFPPLGPPRGKLRGSRLAAVALTDGEMDHATGLLSLREQKNLRLVCTKAVLNLLNREFPVLPALGRYVKIAHASFPFRKGSLHISTLDLSAKVPPYARRAARRGDVVGLRCRYTGGKRVRTLVYLPGLPSITENVHRFVAGCDVLLVDGTFWSNHEMTSLGLTRRTARDMGHIPISGKDGSLAWLRGLNISRKIYIHINNTNPILRKGSREQRIVEELGVEIAYDGMDIRL